MSDEIRALIDAYAAAWRRGDADAVLSLFAPDAVILPHDGVAPRVGHDAMRAFWFGPSRAPWGIDEFRFDLAGSTLRGDTAVAWGSRVLRYWQEHEGARTTYRFSGTVLIVLARHGNAWQITHFMWDDPPPEIS